MTEHELATLFAGTTGDITIREKDGPASATSRDFRQLAIFTSIFNIPVVDLVTGAGEAVGLVIRRPVSAHQPPLPTVSGDYGTVFLGNGAPLLGQPRGVHLAPCWHLHNLHPKRHCLKGLRVKFESVERSEPVGVLAEDSCLNGRSPEEVKWLLDFNNRCAVVFIGSKLFVAWSPWKGGPVKFITVRDFQQREAIRLVEVKTKGGERKTLKMADEWLKWTGRREYVDVRFAPGLQDDTVYNLFGGWAFEPAAGDWSKLREHLRCVICQGDPNAFAWLMTYLAHLFQHPEEKPPTALVISGKKGTGKSIVFDFIQALMPQHFSKVADGKRALGNFNSQNETALFLLLEEAVWAGDAAAESVLKDMITSATQRIERKGVDAYMAPSYFRTGLLSNADWVVPATFDERRFAVFKCGDQHRGDTGYFKAMVDQMNDGGKEAMLFDLLNYVPENGWDVLRTPPKTFGLQEQIIASLRGVDQFILQLAINGLYECEKCEGGGIYLDETRPTSVNIIDVRSATRDHMADNYPGKKAATVDMIDRAVREWFGAVVVKRKVHTNDGRWVEFPSLADIRDHILRTKGIDVSALS